MYPFRIYLLVIFAAIMLSHFANALWFFPRGREYFFPSDNVHFYLFSRERADDPVELSPYYLRPEFFPTTRPLYILIHGFTGNRNKTPNDSIRPALLKKQDAYVISLDFKKLVRKPSYLRAIGNLPKVSSSLGMLINELVDRNLVPNELIHVIGFGLGAHVAGQTAEYVKRKLKRITGLNPARPMFVTAPAKYRLDPDDAEFVDVIHTDVLQLGMLRPLGHADFYPNLGLTQPGCGSLLPSRQQICSHRRSALYYAESIINPEGFKTTSCTSWWLKILKIKPNINVESKYQNMGHSVNSSEHGVFCLNTASRSPFALVPTKPPIKLADDTNYSNEPTDDNQFDD